MAKKRATVSKKVRETVNKPPASCVIPDLLYLGPVSATSNTGFLSREGITQILSIGKSPAAQIEGTSYLRLGLTDEEESDITEVVQRACEFIDAAAVSGDEKVLVHCSAAISRSPTIVAAYLMKRRGMTLRESLQALVKARSVVSPNPGFLRQLSDMEMEEKGERSFDPSGVTSSTRLAGLLEGKVAR